MRIFLIPMVLFFLKFKLFECRTYGFKNCSYFNSITEKNEFKLCHDELVCCPEAKSHFQACCNPPEYKAWNTVLPVQLTLKNIVFILFVFLGVIITGATFITILMGISTLIEKKKMYKPVFIYNSVDCRKAIEIPVEYPRSQGSILTA